VGAFGGTAKGPETRAVAVAAVTRELFAGPWGYNKGQNRPPRAPAPPRPCLDTSPQPRPRRCRLPRAHCVPAGRRCHPYIRKRDLKAYITSICKVFRLRTRLPETFFPGTCLSK
jgi:hypothetical protein